jgi:RNA polymerase-binding protein DksA
MKAEQLAKYRQALLSERQRVLSQHISSYGSLQEGNGLHVDHLADSGSDTYDQNFTANLLDSEREALEEIDEALERLDSDGFGICKSCKQAIPEKRLHVRPSSLFCITCQQKIEAGELEYE